MRRRSGWLLLLAAALMPAGVLAQGIVRWVDAQGHVHYSDHAPPGNTKADAVAPAPAPSGAVVSPSTEFTAPAPGDGGSDARGSSGATSAADTDRKRERDWQQSLAAMTQAGDKATVANCKAQHETYCNKGADYIRQVQKNRAMLDCLNAPKNQYGAPPPACRGN